MVHSSGRGDTSLRHMTKSGGRISKKNHHCIITRDKLSRYKEGIWTIYKQPVQLTSDTGETPRERKCGRRIQHNTSLRHINRNGGWIITEDHHCAIMIIITRDKAGKVYWHYISSLGPYTKNRHLRRRESENEALSWSLLQEIKPGWRKEYGHYISNLFSIPPNTWDADKEKMNEKTMREMHWTHPLKDKKLIYLCSSNLHLIDSPVKGKHKREEARNYK